MALFVMLMVFTGSGPELNHHNKERKNWLKSLLEAVDYDIYMLIMSASHRLQYLPQFL